MDNNIRSAETYRFQLSSYPKCTLRDDFGKLLGSRFICDVEFIVGELDTKLPAHISIVAARSQFLRARIREANDKRMKHLQEEFGIANIPIKDLPFLEVKFDYKSELNVSILIGFTSLLVSQERYDQKNVLVVDLFAYLKLKKWFLK